MNTLKLTKQLISLPSFLDKNINEGRIGDFIYQYFKQFSFLTVIKQPVINGRFNIIVKDYYPTSLLISGHMDTVEPRSGWKTDLLKPSVKSGCLYGLGASDMKSTLGAIMSSVDAFEKTQGLLMLFYIDEEYDFLGMKKFVEEYKNKIKPRLIISGDGSDVAIGNGCRGLIEISIVTKGVSGHASRPESGRNAITKSVNAIAALKNYLKKNYSDKNLSTTTCNLAYLRGGLFLGKNDDKIIIGKEGNNIPDVAEFVLDIRSASTQLTAKKVISILEGLLKREGLVLEKSIIRHDLGSWLTTKNELKNVEKAVSAITPLVYKDLGTFGYNDTQLLWQTFGKTPSFRFGAGEGSVTHAPNEYVTLENLKKTTMVYENFIERFGGGKRKTL